MITNYFRTLAKSFHFSGRSRRSDFWWFIIAQILVVASLFIVNDVWINTQYVTEMYLVLTAPALLSVIVRRLHDVGKSGYVLLALLIPVIGLLYILFLLLKEGQLFHNTYGPNSKIWSGR